MRTVALIVGTRPECIKMAPLYFELMQSKTIRPVLVVTAQHRQMLDQTLAVFGLRPDVDLNLMQPGQGLADLTARVLTSVHSWMTMARPMRSWCRVTRRRFWVRPWPRSTRMFRSDMWRLGSGRMTCARRSPKR